MDKLRAPDLLGRDKKQPEILINIPPYVWGMHGLWGHQTDEFFESISSSGSSQLASCVGASVVDDCILRGVAPEEMVKAMNGHTQGRVDLSMDWIPKVSAVHSISL